MGELWTEFVREVPASVELLVYAYGLFAVTWPIFLLLERLWPVRRPQHCSLARRPSVSSGSSGWHPSPAPLPEAPAPVSCFANETEPGAQLHCDQSGLQASFLTIFNQLRVKQSIRRG